MYTDNMPSWKTVQSRKQKLKKTKLAVAVLGLIIVLVVFAQLTRLSKTLFSPWNLISERHLTWDGKFNINLLLKSEEISLVSYNPKENKIAIIKVPDQTFLDVPQGFGKWQLRAVYDLGGFQLLKKTLADFFGLPIDGFVETETDLLDRNLFSIINLTASKTDLTLWELLRFKISLASVRFDKIKRVDLVELGILDKTALSDGTQVFTADPVRLDSVLSDLVDPAFVSEQKSIAVFNATDHPQLAQKAARMITNLGGHVIIISNAKVRLEKTQAGGEQSATLKRIRQIFGSGDTIDLKDEDLASSRAQINLLLGEDYFD